MEYVFKGTRPTGQELVEAIQAAIKEDPEVANKRVKTGCKMGDECDSPSTLSIYPNSIFISFPPQKMPFEPW